MFDVAANGIADSLDQLFSKKALGAALGTAGQAFSDAASQKDSKTNSAFRLMSNLNQGVQQMPDNKPGKDPTKTQAAQAESPEAVEARWMARLAKFAGISQATGVKLSGF